MNKIKIFLIAGEPSGDVLGGKLIAAIKKQLGNTKEIELLGVGGPKMEEQGLKSIFSINQLSLMGFAEILPHIPKLLNLIKNTANLIIQEQPDLVITIDAPDFCFRVIKKIKKNPAADKIKKIHFIAPTVWAYRPGRAKKIANLFDLLLVILPFEPPYFERHGLKTIFIGHPIVEDVIKSDGTDFRIRHKIKTDDILVCLTPGSRSGEVKRILPEMIGAINILTKKYHNLKVAIPALDKTYEIIKEHLTEFKVEAILTNQSEKNEIFYASNFAIAKSGTNTIELAIAQLPMIVVYKANYLTYSIIKLLSKVKFANLINLILNKEVIPEMIQPNCKAEKLAKKLDILISNPNAGEKQITESKPALKLLGLGLEQKSSDKAAKAILELIN